VVKENPPARSCTHAAEFLAAAIISVYHIIATVVKFLFVPFLTIFGENSGHIFIRQRNSGCQGGTFSVDCGAFLCLQKSHQKQI
jgi:hypothetical protein